MSYFSRGGGSRRTESQNSDVLFIPSIDLLICPPPRRSSRIRQIRNNARRSSTNDNDEDSNMTPLNSCNVCGVASFSRNIDSNPLCTQCGNRLVSSNDDSNSSSNSGAIDEETFLAGPTRLSSCNQCPYARFSFNDVAGMPCVRCNGTLFVRELREDVVPVYSGRELVTLPLQQLTLYPGLLYALAISYIPRAISLDTNASNLERPHPDSSATNDQDDRPTRADTFSSSDSFDIFDQIFEMSMRMDAEMHSSLRNPASKSFIESLVPSPVPSSQITSENGCPVCQTDWCQDDKSVALPCDHHFHLDCILPWLERKHTCPVCRYDLPV